MSSFPWIPIKTELRSVSSGKVIEKGSGYQVLDTINGSKVILIIQSSAPWMNQPCKNGTQADILQSLRLIEPYEFGEDRYWVSVFDKISAPTAVFNLVGPVGSASAELEFISTPLYEMTELFPACAWDTALFIRSERICLATEIDNKKSTPQQKKRLATRLLTGSIDNADLDIRTIQKINPDLSIAEINQFFSALDLDMDMQKNIQVYSVSNPARFSLPGRPELELFFREHIIDYFHRYNDYKRMGINPPNGILLHGAPGTGKTYSVKALADFLGWPVHEIDISSVGSPYIHQTSKMLKEIFEAAAKSAPSIVLMEEIDALGGARTSQMHEHKIEEISQLLRLIETAAKQGILVIGTTNRFQSMDTAITRRGRFDHVIELGFPSLEEVKSTVGNMLKNKPVKQSVDLTAFAEQLLGLPLSDISWCVNEAAKIAVKNNKDEIDQECLFIAAKNASAHKHNSPS